MLTVVVMSLWPKISWTNFIGIPFDSNIGRSMPKIVESRFNGRVAWAANFPEAVGNGRFV
jgi:hypothetical protein